MRTTVMLHVDALRHDYVTADEMPFLHQLSQEGMQARLIPPFGFEPDGAYLTGTHPEVYEGGTHFVFAEAGTRIPLANRLPGGLDYLNKYVQYPLRKGLSEVISRKGETARVRANPFIGFIPFRLLRYFDFNDKYLSCEPEFSKRAPTIFDYLRAEGNEFFYHGTSGHSVRAKDVALRIRNEASAKYAFYFLLIADLDVIGHQYGPESDERRACAKHVDSCLRDIWSRLCNIHGEVDFLAFGDHGMVQVHHYLDFAAVIKRIPLEIGRDYIYFLDSTFARFWAFSDHAKRVLQKELMQVEHGRLVDDVEKEEYRIRFKDRKFGDLIFWLDGGAMIFPSFWHVRSRKKGMHGYRREVMDNHAAAVWHSPHQRLLSHRVTCTMHDLFQTVMSSLGLSAVLETEGHPLQAVDIA
jgi:hypothetical protein